MKRHRTAKPDRAPTSAEIDRLYGLEPVLEPGEPGLHTREREALSVRCPYCGEQVVTHVDLSADETSYIEDCQVCCQPMELTIERTRRGLLAALRARRLDGDGA
jgi:hypothetical protein